MLGLSATINSEEGYAKGERYRERFHTGGTYDVITNPIGRNGVEADYIGDFASSVDDDKYTVSNANVAIISGTLRTRIISNDGYSAIAVSTVPNVQYNISYLNDPNDSTSTDYSLKIGTLAGGSQIATINVAYALNHNTTQSRDFNSGDNSVVWFSWVGNTSGKMIFIDNISFKEA